MIAVEMSDISSGDVTVEGGWLAQVPEVDVESGAVGEYAAKLIRRTDTAPRRAAKEAQTNLQEVVTSGFVRALRRFIAYYAKEYQRRYGDLQGFNPERLQDYFVPGDNRGRRGKPEIMLALSQMRENNDST